MNQSSCILSRVEEAAMQAAHKVKDALVDAQFERVGRIEEIKKTCYRWTKGTKTVAYAQIFDGGSAFVLLTDSSILGPDESPLFSGAAAQLILNASPKN